MHINHQNIRGFTLIELLTVIAMIGILSSVVIAGLSSSRDRAKDRYATAQIQSLIIEATLYKANTGSYSGICGNATVNGILNDIRTGTGRDASCDPSADTDFFRFRAVLSDGTGYCAYEAAGNKFTESC